MAKNNKVDFLLVRYTCLRLLFLSYRFNFFFDFEWYIVVLSCFEWSFHVLRCFETFDSRSSLFRAVDSRSSGAIDSRSSLFRTVDSRFERYSPISSCDSSISNVRFTYFVVLNGIHVFRSIVFPFWSVSDLLCCAFCLTTWFHLCTWNFSFYLFFETPFVLFGLWSYMCLTCFHLFTFKLCIYYCALYLIFSIAICFLSMTFISFVFFPQNLDIVSLPSTAASETEDAMHAALAKVSLLHSFTFHFSCILLT